MQLASKLLEKPLIFYLDETLFGIQRKRARTWGYPQTNFTAQFFSGKKTSKLSVAMIGVLEVKSGLLHHQIKEGHFNADDIKTFLERFAEIMQQK